MVGILMFLAATGGVMPVAINDPDIKSISLSNPDNFMGPPVIRLGTEDRLRLNFDILEESNRYLRYRLIHCNSDWEPSRLLEQEVIEGFNETEISDYATSSNTFIHFVNYNLEIPSEGAMPIASGNYLVQVYDENDPQEILFQTGFYVTEGEVSVNGEVTSRTDRGFNTAYQQVELELTVDAASNINPWQDLIVQVVQNNDPSSRHVTTHPMRVEGSKIIYSHDPALIYPAGNEYRRFETVRSDYPGMQVDSVGFNGRCREAYLTPDSPRGEKSHIYDRTQHGRFKIDEYNSSDPDLGADYVLTRFTLQVPEQGGREIYVDGDFTGRLLENVNRMKYDSEKRCYTADILLKQGSYNYRYIMRDATTGETASSPIEGDYYETDNEYLVLVYLRTPGSRGDRLVGHTLLYSR